MHQGVVKVAESIAEKKNSFQKLKCVEKNVT